MDVPLLHLVLCFFENVYLYLCTPSSIARVEDKSISFTIDRWASEEKTIEKILRIIPIIIFKNVDSGNMVNTTIQEAKRLRLGRVFNAPVCWA